MSVHDLVDGEPLIKGMCIGLLGCNSYSTLNSLSNLCIVVNTLKFQKSLCGFLSVIPEHESSLSIKLAVAGYRESRPDKITTRVPVRHFNGNQRLPMDVTEMLKPAAL